MDRRFRQTVALGLLIISIGSVGVFAQVQIPDFAPGTTAIEALIRVREGIAVAVESGDLPQLRTWLELSERGLPGKSVLWLRQNERLLLAFWLGEYEIALAKPVTERSNDDDARQYLPPDDFLFRRIQEAGAKHHEELKKAVRASGLREDQRYFLLLLLDYLLKIGPLTDEEQLLLNRSAAYFRRRFPRSQYHDYVAETIINPTSLPSEWAFGLDLGLAYTVLLGELQQHFADNWGIVSGVDVAYRRLVAYLRVQLSLQTIKDQFSYGGIWDSGMTAFTVAPEISLGYLVIASPRLKLAPFLGASFLIFVPESGEMQEKLPAYTVLTYNLGLDLDLLIESLGVGDVTESFSTKRVLRTRAAVGVLSKTQDDRFEATTATLALMLQAFFRPRKR